jgi:hypothetical protein
VVALKLDFEKAFDKVDHSFILAVLQAKGFRPLWCKWIKQLLACYILGAAQWNFWFHLPLQERG